MNNKRQMGGGKTSIFSKIRKKLYNMSVQYMSWMYRSLYGMHIGEGTTISRKADLDKTINPQGIKIGKYVRITGNVTLLAHDDCKRMKGDVHIGDNCFIGFGTIILPNVHIGDECIIGAGSVVTKDIPSNCIAVGNPAKVIKSGIHCGPYGRILHS